MERGQKIMDGWVKQSGVRTSDYYKLNPNATVTKIDMENNVRAIRQFELDRFTDWNSY